MDKEKEGELLHRERDKGMANQKLENVLTEVMCMSLHLDRPAVDKSKTDTSLNYFKNQLRGKLAKGSNPL
jgi:hypothetical protein